MEDKSFNKTIMVKGQNIIVKKGSKGFFRRSPVVGFEPDNDIRLEDDLEGKLIGIGKEGFQVLHDDKIYSFYYNYAKIEVLNHDQSII